MEQRLSAAELERALKGGVFTQRLVPGENSGMHARVPDEGFGWQCVDTVELRDSGDLAAVFALTDEGCEEVSRFLDRREGDSDEDALSLYRVEERFDEIIDKAERLPKANWALTRTVQAGWNVEISAAGVRQSFDEPGKNVAEFVSLALRQGPLAAQAAKAGLRVARRFAAQIAESEGWDEETRERKLEEAFGEAFDLIRSQGT